MNYGRWTGQQTFKNNGDFYQPRSGMVKRWVEGRVSWDIVKFQSSKISKIEMFENFWRCMKIFRYFFIVLKFLEFLDFLKNSGTFKKDK